MTQQTNSKTSIHPRELNRLVTGGGAVELLDVRTAPEYTTVHVAAARLVPLDQLDAAAYLRGRGAVDRPIYVICQSGMRARKAIEKFQQAGFNGCVLVEGGTQAWIDAGLPVERGVSKVLPLIRQVQLVIGFFTTLGAALALWLDPRFAYVPLFFGCGLLLAGLTGACPLAILLAKMPWNRGNNGSSNSCCAA